MSLLSKEPAAATWTELRVHNSNEGWPPLGSSAQEWGAWYVHHSSTKLLNEFFIDENLHSFALYVVRDQWPISFTLNGERKIYPDFCHLGPEQERPVMTFSSIDDLYQQVGEVVQYELIQIRIDKCAKTVKPIIAERFGLAYDAQIPLSTALTQMPLPLTVGVDLEKKILSSNQALIQYAGEVTELILSIEKLLESLNQEMIRFLASLFHLKIYQKLALLRALMRLSLPYGVTHPITNDSLHLTRRTELYCFIRSVCDEITKRESSPPRLAVGDGS